MSTQFPAKINVCAGTLGHTTIGLLFKEEILTGELCLSQLEKVIELENNIDAAFNNVFKEDLIHFQQYRAPPDKSFQLERGLMTDILDRISPRSSDLSPLDSFLWGYIKSIVLETQHRDFEDLKNEKQLRGLTLSQFKE